MKFPIRNNTPFLSVLIVNEIICIKTSCLVHRRNVYITACQEGPSTLITRYPTCHMMGCYDNKGILTTKYWTQIIACHVCTDYKIVGFVSLFDVCTSVILCAFKKKYRRMIVTHNLPGHDQCKGDTSTILIKDHRNTL